MNRFAAAALAAVLFASSAGAHEYTAGNLEIIHPMAYETAKTARTGGGYLTITNTGTEPDRLIAVEADYPRVEIHTTVEENGVAKMMPVDGVEIAPGETVALEPGGMHVMFMGLGDHPFTAGDTIPATLVFEKAGKVPVDFMVEARPEGTMGGMGHSGHGMTHGNGATN